MFDSDGSNAGLPLFGDESYQGPPTDDFDSSRAAGVRSFAQGVSVAAGEDASQGTSSPMAAWGNASSQGGARPLDFSFLMAGNKERTMSDAEATTSTSGTGCRAVSPGGERKRPRAWATPNEMHQLGMDADLEDRAPCEPCQAPCPPRRPCKVVFGRVGQEDRGPEPMDPPATRTDPYFWMRGPSGEATPEIRSLMEEENRYAEFTQSHLEPLRRTLYNEMLGHQKEADISRLIPYPGGYGYFTKTLTGRSYGVHFRRKAIQGGASWGPEEFVLDENDLAVDPVDGSQRPYCSVSGPDASPNHLLYAFATDFAGNDSYTIQVRSFDRESRNWSDIKLERTDGSVHWGRNNDCLYYVELDHEFRQWRLRRHVLGHDPTGAADITLQEEADKHFALSICQTSCNRFLILTKAASATSEVNLLDLAQPELGLRRVTPLKDDHMYNVDHRGGSLYILTNKDGVKNSKVCRVSIALLPDAPLDSWEDVWSPGDGTKLENFQCFQNFFAVEGRQGGECRIFVRGYAAGGEGSVPCHTVSFPDAATHLGRMLTPRGATAAKAAFHAGLAENFIFDSEFLHYTYSSFTIPGLTYEYNVRSRENRLVFEQEAPEFDPSKYQAERIITPRRKVPISLVYNKDIHPNGLAGGPFPTLLTGYGAYGACQDPDFDGNRLSLLDRGVVYAVAHVRGGGELGCEWHEAGNRLQVKNRFADFVEAAETLVSLRISSPATLAAWGTSSGGLLVAASANLRPDLFRVLLLEVPFVDAMNTMRDPSIPATVMEWEEVGNPNQREYFYYMLEYSPYDNIRTDEYPAVLATACLNDSMVGHWEPMKYVAKLRALKTDDRPVLLKVNSNAGHGGTSDRYESLKDYSSHFAFLLDQMGLLDAQLLC